MRDEHYFIAELLEKYPDLNQEEREQFNQWLEQGNNKEFFSQILDKEILEEELRQLDELKIESEQRGSWEKLLQFRVKQQKAKTFKLNNWRIYAAASIIILAFIGYKWFGKRENVVTKKTPAIVQDNDAAPGQFKAKLILNDNRVIVLDSASDKVLLQEAGIRVVNKDGLLVYEQTGNSKTVLYNTLTTARRQTYATILSDGTKVWLNSQSSIRYPMAFNSDTRSVETTGEVYFEVAASVATLATGQKGKRPFIVHAPGMDVEVLGTHFNINSYADEPLIKTTLLEGIVKVVTPASAVQRRERKAVYLAPGEQARLVKQTQALGKTKEVDAEGEAAWRFGMFQFNNADLPTVMRQLGRWYDVEIEYRGNVQEREFIGTIPRSLNLSKVVLLLEKQNVHFTIEGKKIIVTP